MAGFASRAGACTDGRGELALSLQSQVASSTLPPRQSVSAACADGRGLLALGLHNQVASSTLPSRQSNWGLSNSAISHSILNLSARQGVHTQLKARQQISTETRYVQSSYPPTLSALCLDGANYLRLQNVFRRMSSQQCGGVRRQLPALPDSHHHLV